MKSDVSQFDPVAEMQGLRQALDRSEAEISTLKTALEAHARNAEDLYRGREYWHNVADERSKEILRLTTEVGVLKQILANYEALARGDGS